MITLDLGYITCVRSMKYGKFTQLQNIARWLQNYARAFVASELGKYQYIV
jgi:hypothetical protein